MRIVRFDWSHSYTFVFMSLLKATEVYRAPGKMIFFFKFIHTFCSSDSHLERWDGRYACARQASSMKYCIVQSVYPLPMPIGSTHRCYVYWGTHFIISVHFNKICIQLTKAIWKIGRHITIYILYCGEYIWAHRTLPTMVVHASEIHESAHTHTL